MSRSGKRPSGADGSDRSRFRYRTAVLTGQWRLSADEAIRDAVRAGQATVDEGTPDGVRWIVPGEIEKQRPETE